MTAMRWMVLVGLVLTAATNQALAQGRFAASLPTEQLLNSAGLTRAWWGHAVSNAVRDKIQYLTLDDSNRLYVESSNGVMTCFDAESGRRLWATRLGRSDEVIMRCSYSEDLVFGVHGNTCYAVRKAQGDIIWELALPGTPTVSPVSDGKHLYIGMLDGSMYAFDYRKINDLSQKGLMPRWSYTTTVWRYQTSEQISSPAIPSGRLVAFASASGSLYSVTADDRRLVFQFETDANLSAPIVRYRDWLILSGEDFNVYALHVDNGKIGWQFPAGFDIRKSPMVIRDDIYIMPERGGMHKLQGDTGKSQWWNPRASDFVSASPDRLYVRGPGNNVMVLSAADGSELATLPLEAFGLHVRNTANDRIYLATPSGLIVCLRELGLDFPAAHSGLDDKPIVPVLEPEDAPGNTQPPAAEPEQPNATEPAATEPAVNESQSDM